jgi:hypothetical protein
MNWAYNIRTALAILALVCTTTTHAQTKLELEFLNQLNTYRKQYKLGPAKYDTTVSRVAAYHCGYMAKCERLGHSVHKDKLPHDEQFDIKDHMEMSFARRAGMAPNSNIWCEIQIASFHTQKGRTLAETARAMVMAFDSSPGHKEAMLYEDHPKITGTVGISIVLISKTELHELYSVNVDFGYTEK